MADRPLSILALSPYTVHARRSAAQSLLDLLRALARRGHRVHLVAPAEVNEDSHETQLAAGLHVHAVGRPAAQPFALKLMRALPVVRRSEIDIGAEMMAALPARAERVIALAGVDTVLTLPPPGPSFWTALWLRQRHGLPVATLPGETMADEWFVSTPVTRLLLQPFVHFVTNPYDVATLIRAGCGEGMVHQLPPFFPDPASAAVLGATPVPNTHVSGVGPPGPLTEADWNANPMAQRHGIPFGPSVLFVGRQSTENDIRSVLEMMALLWRQHPMAKLILAGEPTVERDRELAKLEAIDARMTRQVHRVDRFDESELASLIPLASVVVTTGRRDPLARNTLVAWAHRRVPVGDPLGGAWLLSQNETGLWASAGNPATLARVVGLALAEEAFRENMANEGYRRFMRQHTATLAAERVEQVLMEMVALRAVAGIRRPARGGSPGGGSEPGVKP
jgi:glycosyltransferase involved in cell wall biosynthesis